VIEMYQNTLEYAQKGKVCSKNRKVKRNIYCAYT